VITRKGSRSKKSLGHTASCRIFNLPTCKSRQGVSLRKTGSFTLLTLNEGKAKESSARPRPQEMELKSQKKTSILCLLKSKRDAALASAACRVGRIKLQALRGSKLKERGDLSRET